MAHGIVDIALRRLARTRLGLTNVDTQNAGALYQKLLEDGLTFTNTYGPELYYEIFDKHLDESNEQRAVIKEAIEHGQEKSTGHT